MSALLSFGTKTSGQPHAIHPPWKKARVVPLEEREGSTDRGEKRKGEVKGRGVERGEAAGREIKRGETDEGKERRREKRSRGEIETWRGSSRSSTMNNGMRNVVDGREASRSAHRGELPGLLSAGHFASLDGGILINGSYFQTSVEASKPPPVKQKALSLISLTRRLQGPSRVGDEQWGNGKSWQRGGESGVKMNDSIADMSVSASVSEGAMGEEQRRWERPLAVEKGFSDQRWKREPRFHDGDSKTASGSKESPSECNASAASSASSSLAAERNKNSSDTEAGNSASDSRTEREGTTPESDSGRRGESGAESEEEWKDSSRKRSKGNARNSSASMNSIGDSTSRRRSAKVQRGKTNRMSSRRRIARSSKHPRHSDSTASSSRPQTSRRSGSTHKKVEEEEESEEGEEEEDQQSRRARLRNLSQQEQSRVQSDIGSGGIDVTEDLSPILEEEEEEEEERSSSCTGEENEDKEEGDLENELAH